MMSLLVVWQNANAAPMPFALNIASSVSATETPTIHLRPTLRTKVAAMFHRVKPVVTRIALTDAAGTQITVPYQQQTAALNNAAIAIPKPENFHPGKYQASVTTRQGNAERTIAQEFSWGVLALNVPSATVEPWQDVPLHLAVLDDRGGMVCDAAVAMTITTPSGKSERFQTGAATNKWRIRTNPACAVKARTEQPDYEAHYRPIVPGTYSVHVIADTKNGRQELSDSFRVQEHVPFLVKRNTFPTRIYPAAAYPVEFSIHPDDTYNGTFTEFVPDGFIITAISGNGAVRQIDAERQSITWNVDWKAGQEYKLGYTFDAPDASPAFYQLGPYKAGSIIESRQWQIASDATKTWDGGGGADTNWSNALNWSDDAVPDSSSDIAFSGSSNNNSVWDASATATVNSISITTYTGTLTITGPSSAAAVTGAFSDTAGGLTISSGTTLTVGGDFTLTTSGTFTATGSTVTLTGTSNNLNSSKTFVNLTIDPTTPGTITTLTNSPTVSSTLTVAVNDTLSIGSGLTVTSNTTGTVTLNGTIGGTGTLVVQNSNLSTGGTFSSGSTVRFDATSGNITVPARTYGGNVVIYNVSTADRTITLGTTTSQTITVTGNLTVNAAGTKSIQLEGATYNPAVSVTGNVSFSKDSSGIPLISAGTGTWTVSGSFNMTNGFFGPVLNKMNPSWDRTAKAAETYDCETYSTVYSCPSATATTMTVGDDDKTENGTVCPAVYSKYRIGMKFGTSAITDTDTILQTTLAVNVTTVTASGETIFIQQPSGSTPDTASCTAEGGVFDQLAGTTTYLSASNWTTTGYKTNDLGAAAASDLKTTLTGTDVFYLGFINAGSGLGNQAINSVDNSTNKPVFVVSSVPSGSSPKLIMNGTGTTLTTAGNTLYGLTLSGSVTLANETITVAGNVDFTGATITAGSSTLQMTGTTATLTGGGATLNNLTIDPPTAGTTTFSTSDLIVSGLLTVATGDTLSLGSGLTLTLSGNSGTTLTLNGTISGSGRLTYQNSATTMTTAGTLSTIVRFDATNGNMNIPLRTYSALVEALTSTSTSRTVTLGTATSQTFTFTGGLTIGDGTNAVIFQAGSYNPAVNVSGNMTINANATYTKSSSGVTFNGTTAATYTDSTATPQNLGIVSLNKTDTVAAATNDKLTLASSMTVDTMTVDGTAGQADTLNLGTGGYTLTLANAGATTTVLTNSGTFTAGTSTVKFSATNSGGDINVPALAYNSIELAGAETYDLAGNLTSGNAVTGSVAVDSGATLDATTSNYSMEVGGNWTMAGTFTPRAGTVTFNGTTTQTLITGSQAFSELTLNNTGTVGTANDDIIPSGTLTVGGDLTITQGELKLSTNNPAIAVAGNVTIGASGIFTKGTGTLTFDGTAAATFTDSTSTKQNLGTVSLNKTNTSSPSTNDKLTLASSMTVDTMTIDGTAGQADTLDLGSSGYTLKLANAASSANVLTVNGTLTVGTSTVDYAATNNSGSINVVGVNYSSLSLSGSETYVVSDDITVSGTLTTGSSSTLSISSGKKVSHTGSSMTNNGTISGSGTLRFTDTSSGPGTGGTISTTVQYDASSADIGSSTVDARTYGGSVDFYANTTVDRTITLASGTYTLSGGSANLTVTNNGTGTLTVVATANPDVTVGGSVSFAGVGAGTAAITSGSGTWAVSGDVNFTGGTYTASSGNTLMMDGSSATFTSAGQQPYNFTVSGGSVAMSGNTTIANTLTISGGTLTAPSGTLTVDGSFDNDGAFTNNSGTLVLGASSGTHSIDALGTGSSSLNNLTLNGGATWNLSTALTVNGTLTVNGGTFGQGANAITAGALTVNGGTFSGGTGTLDINGTLTISAGTMTAPSGDTTVSGNFTHSGGTFNHNTGTIVLDGTDQTLSGATTFYSLKKTGSTARTLTFPASTTQTIVGTLTLKGANDALLSLRSSTDGTQWKIDPQGTRDIEYLDVKDGYNIHTTIIETSGMHVTNSGNNTGWAFPPSAPSDLSGTPLSSTKILWSWTDTSDNETGFSLLASDGSVAVTVATANTTSVIETGLVKGIKYTRQVVAYNGNGDSEPSDSASATTNASAPAIPRLEQPDKDALLNTLTPSFSFSRSSDDDDGMGTYALLLNDSGTNPKTVSLSEAKAGASTTLPLAEVSATDTTITATLSDDTLLQEGSNTWKVRAIDTADNVSDSEKRTLIIDISKPSITSLSIAPTVKQRSGIPSADWFTTDQRPVLSITATDNNALDTATLEYKKKRYLLGEEIGQVTQKTITQEMQGTKQTVTMQPAQALPYGNYALVITLADAAGNANTATRTLALISPETAAAAPTAGTETGAEEREKDLERGETPSKTPVDLTLPELEKHAQERRQEEADHFREFLERIVPKNWLARFEYAFSSGVATVRQTLLGWSKTAGIVIARAFGFTSDTWETLRRLARKQSPCTFADCPDQRFVDQQQAPLLASLQRGLPKVFGNVVVQWQSFRANATYILVQARKNRSHVAASNERSLARVLEPIAKARHWVGVGARVAWEGIVGEYENQLAITDVTITAIDAEHTIIQWKTNRQTRGKINYGLSPSFGQEILEQHFTSDHTLTLESLSTQTKYYFEVLATDIDGKQTFDAYYSFTTP